MRGLLFIVILVSALLSLGSTVIACGGYEVTSIDRMVEFSELVVSARVDYVDDLGENAILQVDRYFKGNGGEYVAVVGTRPAAYYADSLRDYSNGCFNIGPYGFKFEKDEVGYYALQSNGDGTYGYYYESVWIPGNVLAYRTLESTEGLVEFYLYPRSEHEFETPAPEEEFEKLLLQLGDANGTTPPAPNPYPLKRYLNITTETGERYRLNPDRSVTWLDPAIYPSAISNDGSHVMFRLDDGELGFQYLATSKQRLAPWLQVEESAESADGRQDSTALLAKYGWLHPVSGQFAQFSPNGNFVAVQEETRLAVHLFSSVEKEGAIVGYGHRMAMREIADFDVGWRSTEERQPLVWSADSKAIAYQDSQGIWLWKFIEQAEPQLVVHAREGQELLDLSATGRYLRFGRPADWTLHDVQTGDTWKDSLITPDESRLIHFLSYSAEDYLERLKQLKQCSLPLISCPIVLTQSPHTGVGSGELPQDVFWHEPDLLGLVYRDAFQSLRWSYALEDAFCELWICRGVRLPPIHAFAYDSRYEQPAFAFEDSRIGFGIRESDDYYDSIDLSEHLDSPIVDLEWGQPIFYEGR